ncbi:hypothetical protein EDD26_0719 [Agrococcus jenensis]|uniref:Uncharacterized protein n=2 Tax=Agrococcus jenensis TaxID=46353 RepID=A0A3N2AQM2_9MICO|nr:hypothetical protein EDD26_0719 [Agrococcus jenensis]
MGTSTRRWGQTPGRALSARTLLLLGATVVLLITGLLGMHALGGSAGGHGSGHAIAGHADVGQSSAAITAGDDHGSHAAPAHHAQDAAAAARASGCTDACAADGPAAPGHSELMACVLALLAGLLVLVPPARLGIPWASIVNIPTSADASAARAEPPTPSLILLSISRT